MKMYRRLSAAAACAAAVLAVPATTGAAQSRASTFDGSCDIAVKVSFDPPLTNTPQAIDQTVRGTGLCTGTFVDRGGRTHELSHEPIGYDSFSHAENSSCLAGLNMGSGALTFRYGKLRFAFTERRASAVPTLEYTGLAGGSALGAGHPASDADPVAAAQACAGDGLDSFDVEGSLQTTPSISG
jgi:hypothetical protein